MTRVVRRLRGREEGFTLIELMVVVLIIGILIAIALPTFLGTRARSQNKQAQSSLRNAHAAARVCFTENGVYNDPATPCDDVRMEVDEPSLTFLPAGSTSTGPNVVSVSVGSATVWYEVAWSNSGTCFGIRDNVNVGTSFATVGIDPATCTGAAANALAAGSWVASW